MFRQVESVSSIASDPAWKISNAAAHWTATLQEFVLRLRRAGLLFFAALAALLAFDLAVHSMGLLLWLIALPLAGFGALLSMFWPTRRFSKRRSGARGSRVVRVPALASLARRRGEIPLAARPAFDLVIERAKRNESFAGAADDLLRNESQRLIGQHLPRLIQSFLSLPSAEQTAARSGELAEGLAAIAEELHELNERLLESRTDRFEIERRFIANRYPRRGGLAGV